MSIPPSDDVIRRRKALGANIKARRTSSGRTQEEVAIAANLDRSFYVEVERGKHSLVVDRLFAIADALGVRASDLLSGIQ